LRYPKRVQERKRDRIEPGRGYKSSYLESEKMRTKLSQRISCDAAKNQHNFGRKFNAGFQVSSLFFGNQDRRLPVSLYLLQGVTTLLFAIFDAIYR
jgi:hypothetical protein